MTTIQSRTVARNHLFVFTQVVDPILDLRCGACMDPFLSPSSRIMIIHGRFMIYVNLIAYIYRDHHHRFVVSDRFPLETAATEFRFRDRDERASSRCASKKVEVAKMRLLCAAGIYRELQLLQQSCFCVFQSSLLQRSYTTVEVRTRQPCMMMRREGAYTYIARARIQGETMEIHICHAHPFGRI